MESRQTLLHIAVDNGDMEIAKLLLSRGADINARGFHGFTALHLAVDADCDNSANPAELSLTKLLIESGADEYVCDDDGEIPRGYCSHLWESNGAAL